MLAAAEFGTGQVLWSMFWLVLFVIWIWLLVVVFGDIIRSRDLSGWGKAGWTILIIVLPYLGVFAYLIARGDKMQQHAEQAAQQEDAAARAYVQDVAASSGDTADEITRLADLRDRGMISEEDFQRGKAKALGYPNA